MWNSTVTVETTWMVFTKLQWSTVWLGNLPSECRSQRTESKYATHLCTHLQSSLLTTAKWWTKPKYPLSDEGINKMWYICTQWSIFTLEREGTLVYATAGWDFVQNKLVTPTKKFYLCEVLHVIQHPTPSDRKQRGGYLDTGGKERTRSCGLVRTAFQYYKIKRFQHLLHNVNKHYWPAHLINCYMASPPSPKRRLEAGIQPSI